MKPDTDRTSPGVPDRTAPVQADAAEETLSVRKQVRLSASKCVELVLNGIRFRLFRASVTVTIIALAMAFLMTMLVEALVNRRVAEAVDIQTMPRRTFLFWLDRFSVPMSETRLTREAGRATDNDARWQEYAAWGELNDEQLGPVVETCREALTYLSFFEGISDGDLRPLVGRARGLEIFSMSQSPDRLAALGDEVRKLGRKFPTTLDVFGAFLVRWQDTAAARRAIMAGHRRAVQRLSELARGRGAVDVLAAMEPGVREQVAALGYSFADEQALEVGRQAQVAADIQKVLDSLGVPLVRQRLAIRLRIQDVATIVPAMLLAEVRTSAGAQWFLDVIADTGEELGLSAARLRDAAADRLARDRLDDVKTALGAGSSQSGSPGFSPRVLCLIAVSMLVCVVGIANAMLMSVMERFREIATMKCLGATDGFVMVNFILESCCQGLAGGIIGALSGLFLGILRSVTVCGWMAVHHVPGPELVAAGAAAVGLGIVISALAAVYPATVAARLAPMEAMRVQ